MASLSRVLRRSPRLQGLVVIVLLGTAILPLLLVHTRLFSVKLFHVRDDTGLPLIGTTANREWGNPSKGNKEGSHSSEVRDTVQEEPSSSSKALLLPEEKQTKRDQHENQSESTSMYENLQGQPSSSDIDKSGGSKSQKQPQGMEWSEGCLVRSPTNQQELLESDTQKTGLVVILAMAPEDHLSLHDTQQRICHALPNQLEYLLAPQGWDMLLVVEEDEMRGWTVRSFVKCLNLVAKTGPTQTWNNLDGTTLETMAYQYQSKAGSPTVFSPTVFLASSTVQDPVYIQQNPSLLNIPITPRSCQAPKSYIQATRYYTRELLHLAILKEYDYFIKLDTDILLTRTIPFNLLHDMSVKGAVFAHTAQYLPKGSKTCAMGIQAAVLNFTSTMSSKLNPKSGPPELEQGWRGSMCSVSPEVQRDTDEYYTNFVLGLVKFWQSPFVLAFSTFLNEFPEGFFRYRWTDQIFWHYAMALFLKGRSFQDYVVDYTDLRCMPLVNCWQSSYNFQRFGANAWHRCDNGGYFLHTKDYSILQSFKGNERNGTTTGTLEALSQQEPFQSTYLQDCAVKK
jgi:hypothetical protein